MNWNSYPIYKDSGIDWLGKIPEGWQTKTVWMLFKLGRGRVISNEEIADHPGEYPVYSSQTENDGILGFIDTYDFSGEYLTWTTDGANAGTVFKRHGRFNCTNVCGTLSAKDQQSTIGFFRYAIDQATQWFVRHDINPKLMNNVMASIRVPAPSYDEQHAIAVFLDQETKRIDTLISKKERQIELLQEKRAALISQLVNKGLSHLNKALPKEIWVEGQLGRFIKLQRGFDITGADERDEGFPVFSSGGLSGHSDKPMVQGPGVIVGRKGTLGTVYYSEEDYWPHDTTLWVKEFRGNYPRFVYYYLIYMRLENLDVGAANPTLNRNHVHPIPVRFPDRDSQMRIANYLDKKTSYIAAITEKIKQSIGQHREYQTALISAAVTGKIDVRKEAPPCPDSTPKQPLNLQ